MNGRVRTYADLDAPGSGKQTRSGGQPPESLRQLQKRAMEFNKFMERYRKFSEEMEKIETKSTAAALDTVERIHFLAQRQIELIERQAKEVSGVIQALPEKTLGDLDKREMVNSIKEQRKTLILAVQAEANAKIVRENQKVFDKMGKNIDTFVERVGRGAKNFGEVWKRMQNEVTLSFAKFTLRLLSRWLLSVKEMKAITERGIFGALFNLGRHIPGIGGFFDFIANGSFRRNAATATPQIPDPKGGSTSVTRAQLLASLGQAGVLAAGTTGFGLLLGAARRGGPVRGGIGGALLGGAVGTAIAGVALKSLLGGLIYGGPFGAVVGAIIGGALGILGRGKAKRRATAIEEDFMRRAQQVVKEYKSFQVAFEPAISQVEALRLRGVQTLTQAGLGRAGRRGAENLTFHIDRLAREVRNLQRQRDMTFGQLQEFVLPEFQLGGPVSAFLRGRRLRSARGGMLALLHAGEFVLRREAVQSLGESLLSRLNAAPQVPAGGPPVGAGPAGSGGDVHVHFNVNAVDGASVDRFWRSNEGRIIRTVRRAIQDRAL